MKKFILIILLVISTLFPVGYSNANDIVDFFKCMVDPDDEDCEDSGHSGIIRGGSNNSVPRTNPYSGDFSITKGTKDVGGKINDIYNTGSASDHIQKIISYLLTFLTFIVVLIIIYAGFYILTAGGDEEKVTKAKKIIIYAIGGLIVIYLAGPITEFILSMFKAGT